MTTASGAGPTFKSRRVYCPGRTAQAQLRAQPPEREAGSFDPGIMHFSLCSGTAYSLPHVERQVYPVLGERAASPSGGDRDDSQRHMHMPLRQDVEYRGGGAA